VTITVSILLYMLFEPSGGYQIIGSLFGSATWPATPESNIANVRIIVDRLIAMCWKTSTSAANLPYCTDRAQKVGRM
jgi:hypothetical protein